MWMVGSGKQVKFWRDCWVPNLSSGRILSVCPSSCNVEALVSDWQNEDNGAWNFPKVGRFDLKGGDRGD